MFCTQCGVKNRDGASFCKNCRAPLPSVRKQSVASHDPVSQSGSEHVRQIQPVPMQRKKWLLIAVVALLLVAGSVLALFLSGVLDGESRAQRSTEPSVPGTPANPEKIGQLSVSAEQLDAESETGVHITLSPFLYLG
ncbi:MAG: zinc ribbon domain-containing protein [Oscillospiraceae bacterium]|nr:zinc ribbon domain-containing protein [Oscillospiraceae bacterium]